MKAFVMPLLLGLLLITGCKEQETVDPTFTVTAKASTDQSVQVGQQVSLDGLESSDSQGKPPSRTQPSAAAMGYLSATALRPMLT